MAPWLLKNYAVFNAPFYPVQSGKDVIFEKLGYSCMDYFRMASKHDTLFILEVNPHKYQYVSNLKLAYKNFVNGESSFSLLDPGFIFIALFPLLVINFTLLRRNLPILFLGTISSIYIILSIIFFSGQVWYLFPALVGLMLVFLYIIEHSNKTTKKISIGLIMIFIFQRVLFGFAYFSLHYSNIYSYNSEMISLEHAKENDSEDHSDFSDSMKIWNYLNEHYDLGDNSLILDFTDTQGYFLKDSYKRYIPSFYGYLFSCLSDRGDIQESFKRLNVRYIIYDETLKEECQKSFARSVNFLCDANKKFEKFLVSQKPAVIYVSGNIKIYDVQKS